MNLLFKKIKKSPFFNGLYDLIFEWNRLLLPTIQPSELHISTENIEIPIAQPLEANEDTPWSDIVFILALGKSIAPKRILEIGTYRSRTTYALSRNLPDATITTYDIQELQSPFRDRLSQNSKIHFCKKSFSADKNFLITQEKFDFIFVDRSHLYEDVLLDTELSLQILTENGVIIWHDYRPNSVATRKLRVPEALSKIARDKHLDIRHVNGTTCAIFFNETNPKIRKA